MADARHISFILFLCCSFFSVLVVQCDTKTLTVTSRMNCSMGGQTLEEDDVLFIQYNGAMVRKCDLSIKAEYGPGQRGDRVICLEAISFHVDCSVKVQYYEAETFIVNKTYSCYDLPTLWCSSKSNAFIRITAPLFSPSNFRIKARVKEYDATDLCNNKDDSHRLSCPSGCCGPSDNQYCCNHTLDIRTIGGIAVACVVPMILITVIAIVCCCFRRRKAKASRDRTLHARSIPWFTTTPATASTATSDIQMTTTPSTLGLLSPPYRPNAPLISEYPSYEYCNPSNNFALNAKQYDDPPPSYEQIRSC
ncbi:hypothetical protein ACJMK2_041151 [Sinanodonta woodiana]|uniref:Uncharacterized protein n=1 Tax=Sinanodonta woodiana TaxID=1069815 RepID=A0ABD3W3A9_SINWO